MNPRNSYFAAIFLVGTLASQLAAAAAGTPILADGEVSVLDSKGSPRAAKTGMSIDAGETLQTRVGRAQVQFTDGGLVRVQPSTEFKITDYRFSGADKPGESAVFNLIKGGLRAITGLIGRRDRAAYRMETTVATIGIRGTAFQARLCLKDCPEPDGLYVLTTDGIVALRNIAGEIEISRGQAAYVATPTAPPKPTRVMPVITARAAGTGAPSGDSDRPPSGDTGTPPIGDAGTPPIGDTGTPPTGDTGTPPTGFTIAAIPGVGTGTEFQTGDLVTATPYTHITPLEDAGILLAASGSGSVDFGGRTYTQSGAAIGAGINSPGAIVSAYMNNNEVRGFIGEEGSGAGGGIINDIRNLAGENPYGSHGSVLFDRVLDVGGDGVLYWGRWTGANVSLHALLNGYDAQGTFAMPAGVNIHYMLGTSVPVIPEAGFATYSFTGGTKSTDVSGMAGTGITSGSLDVNFLQNSVGAHLTIDHNGVYHLNAYMPMNVSNRATFGTNVGEGFASTTGAGNYNAQVSGFFAGTNAPNSPSHAGVTYNIMKPGNGIVGVGAFGCTSGC